MTSEVRAAVIYIAVRVIASEAKQSSSSQTDRWIASPQ